MPGNSIEGIFDDREHGLLIATRGGLVHWRQEQFIVYSPGGADFGSSSYLGRSGALWNRDGAGLHRFKDGRLTTFPVPDGTAMVCLLAM